MSREGSCVISCDAPDCEEVVTVVVTDPLVARAHATRIAVHRGWSVNYKRRGPLSNGKALDLCQGHGGKGRNYGYD